MSRQIPIVMDEGALSDAARKAAAEHGHDHADDPSQPLPGPAPAYVRVGGVAITEADVAKEMQHHRAPDPHRARADAARALVVRELLRREAERLGIPAVADGRESAEEAQVRLLLDQEVQTPLADEAQCRRWFEQNRDRLRHPDRVKARHILLAAAPQDLRARARAAEQGEALIAELREHPERFTEFAMRHSACSSRDAGGELGWVERGDTTPEFDRQLFMLREGLAGLTVESRYGHHVVMVDAIERGASMDFAEAAPRIAAYLDTQVRQNAIHEYLQILEARYGVEGLNEIDAMAA